MQLMVVKKDEKRKACEEHGHKIKKDEMHEKEDELNCEGTKGISCSSDEGNNEAPSDGICCHA